MAESRRIPYKSPTIHRPARIEPSPGSTARPQAAKPSFAEMLAKRSGSGSPRSSRSRSAVAPGQAYRLETTELPAGMSLADELELRIAQALRDSQSRAEHDEAIDVDESAEVDPVAAAAAAVPVDAADRPVIDAAQYVAQAVSRFCNDAAVGQSDGWQISLDLDPEVLRDTRLDVSLSRQWLVLRFSIGDAHTKSVVLANQVLLEQLLDEAVVPRREISISID
jgi:Type III secretion protein (HpaP)